MTRVIVLLYENLRYHLIKIIDEYIDVDQQLAPSYIDFIKAQQDVIDDYLKRFSLKTELNFEITPHVLERMKYPESIAFIKEFLNDSVRFDAHQELYNMRQKSSKERAEISAKLKEERERVLQRMGLLKQILKTA